MLDDLIAIKLDNVPDFSLSFGEKINLYYKDTNSSPDYEPWTTQIFVKMLSQSPKFLDIGANIGWYSCIASAVSEGRAIVHAFEPEPGNFSQLHKNIEANGFDNIKSWPIAVGSENSKAKLFLSKDNPGDHRLSSNEDREAIDIEVARIDTLLSDGQFVPDLVKIDVQGAEPLVFLGAKETFASAGDTMAMLIEFQPESLGLKEAHKLADSIFAFNRPVFDLYPYDGGALRPIDRKILHEAIEGCLHPSFPAHIDILIAPLDDRFDAVRHLIGSPFVQWQYDQDSIV
jgi:FkbM family methyltransferase